MESPLATHLALDQERLDRAIRVSGEPTKTAAVSRALQECIARREQRRVAELFGKLEGMLGLLTRPNGLASRESAG